MPYTFRGGLTYKFVYIPYSNEATRVWGVEQGDFYILGVFLTTNGMWNLLFY